MSLARPGLENIEKFIVKHESEGLMSYSNSYFDIIRRGLDSMTVTDGTGKEIDADKGLEIWADKAYELQKKTNGLIFFCGNGASATMAEHMSHDWFQNAAVNTATCAETSHITAISNDLSYEDVFSYRVKRILSEKDMLVGISSSGNSPNIVRAISAANENRAFTISISGKRKDNMIHSLGKLNFYVPLETYGETESAHAVLLHAALDFFLDKYMGGRH